VHDAAMRGSDIDVRGIDTLIARQSILDPRGKLRVTFSSSTPGLKARSGVGGHSNLQAGK
jgi:hypothetical protein